MEHWFKMGNHHIPMLLVVSLFSSILQYNAWKVSLFGVFLFRIFPQSESVFSPKAGKYRPKKLGIRSLSSQQLLKNTGKPLNRWKHWQGIGRLKRDIVNGLLVSPCMRCFAQFHAYVMFCAIWYHLYNLKNMKNTHGGVLFIVKLLVGVCNFA